MALLGVVCCKDASRAPSAERTAETTTARGEAPAASSPQAVGRPAAYAEAALALGYLLRADAPAWDEIRKKYETARPHIEAVDASQRTRYGEELTKALGDIEAGRDVSVNTHIVTKGLQHVTVLMMSNMLERALGEETEAAKKTIQHIESVFTAIEPTFERRDATVYGEVPTLAPAARQALGRLRTAKDRPGRASAGMLLSSLLSKTYTLSVLYEMKGVEELCGELNKDPAECAVKRAEAGMYYRVIRPSVEARDKAAATQMQSLIDGTTPGAKYATARDLLARALPFTVQELSF